MTAQPFAARDRGPFPNVRAFFQGRSPEAAAVAYPEIRDEPDVEALVLDMRKDYQAKIAIAFILYAFVFGWIGYRRGQTREAWVFGVASISLILLRLQAEHSDWTGARKTLGSKLKHGSLPRDVYRRRDAVLAVSEAKDVIAEGNSIEAREAAIEANRLSPDLIPAAVMAARGYIEKGKPRNASRIVIKAWEAHPHPDLAAVFAEIEPGETPISRIKRFGALPIMGVGVLLNLLCIGIALSGVDLHQFLIALFLLGVGWNFLFTGSTTLAMQAYRPEEKDKAQAAINFFVFATMALTSFASGALVTTQGWALLNLGSLAPVALLGLSLLWLALKRRAHARAL